MLKKLAIDFYFHPDGLPIDKLYVFGSWDQHGHFHQNWVGPGTPMIANPDGSYHAQVELHCKPGQEFWWGVKDGREHWMLFEQKAIGFVPYLEQKQSFLMGFRHKLGIHRSGSKGFRAGVWAPRAKKVTLSVRGPEGEQTWPMTCQNEFWHMKSSSGWSDILGLPYGFRITTSCGQQVLRADPYARVRQGPQRGVTDLFVNSLGDYAHRYNVTEKGAHHLRFEAVSRSESTLSKPPVLRLYRNEKQLDRAELEKLLDKKAKIPSGETWWIKNAEKHGDISLAKAPGVEAYSVCLGPEINLRGLSYSLEDELGTPYHDPWSQVLDGHHNWPRLGLVQSARHIKEKLARPLQADEDVVIYQLHVGSILGQAGNLKTSHFGDVEEKLTTLKRLGFNAVALMPSNATEGWRDWGYLGTSSMAHQEAYASPGSDAESSLIKFVEKAHSLNFRVFTDVVYNHIGGFHNDLWEFDGLENSWFERSEQVLRLEGDLPYRPFQTTDAKPRTTDPTVRDTPWGPIPAYTKLPVRQFFIDHAVDQIERIGFDGIRFDFTHLIHAQGKGGEDGWRMLRSIHRRIRHFFPEVITFAEEFPPHPIITQPVDEGGAGFTGMWNTEHQHRLIFDHHKSSIMQSLVDENEPPLDYFTQHLLCPEGFSDPNRSATVLSNHDEVGNAQRIYNIVKKHPRGLDIARLVSWFSLLCPGYPLLFQGTEDLASNYFSWGLPHTWDLESHLAGGESPDYRKRHLESIKDVLSLRKREPYFWAHSPLSEFYRDTYHHVLGIRRGKFWILANFDPKSQALPSNLTQGELVLNSERATYGYLGKVTRGSRIGGFALKVWKLPTQGHSLP